MGKPVAPSLLCRQKGWLLFESWLILMVDNSNARVNDLCVFIKQTSDFQVPTTHLVSQTWISFSEEENWMHTEREREMEKQRKDYFAALSGQGNLYFMIVLARLSLLCAFFQNTWTGLDFYIERTNSSYLWVQRNPLLVPPNPFFILNIINKMKWSYT